MRNPAHAARFLPGLEAGQRRRDASPGADRGSRRGARRRARRRAAADHAPRPFSPGNGARRLYGGAQPRRGGDRVLPDRRARPEGARAGDRPRSGRTPGAGAQAARHPDHRHRDRLRRGPARPWPGRGEGPSGPRSSRRGARPRPPFAARRRARGAARARHHHGHGRRGAAARLVPAGHAGRRGGSGRPRRWRPAPAPGASPTCSAASDLSPCGSRRAPRFTPRRRMPARSPPSTRPRAGPRGCAG